MVRKLLGLILLSLGLCLLEGQFSPVAAYQQADPAKKSNPVVTSATKPAGTMTGKITAVDHEKVVVETTVLRRKQKVELLIAEDVKVRMPPEVQFDEKGHARKSKPDPNDKDRKLGGVKGAKADLQAKQEVQVTLGRLPNNKLVANVIQVLVDPKRGGP